MKMILLFTVFVALYPNAIGSTSYTNFLDRPIPIFAERLEGEDLVDYINVVQPFFTAESTEVSEEEHKALLMDPKFATPDFSDLEEPQEENSNDVDIPESYDARVAWPQCKSVHLVRYQHCGNCWAVAAASSMSDRLCIQSNGTTQKMVSDIDITYCCGYCGGCNGGWPEKAAQYITTSGTCSGGPAPTKDVCKVYHKPGVKVDRSCIKGCQEGFNKTYEEDKIYAKKHYIIRRDVAKIQKEIMTNGPVAVYFKVYTDWRMYKKGIYVHTAGKVIGSHAVKLIGWGVENEVPYWIAANSWGPAYGEKGHFRIIRGRNECGIENNAVVTVML